MGINLNAHGWNDVAETNDQHAPAQVAAETLSVEGEKKSPADVTGNEFLDNKENNSEADYNTTATELQKQLPEPTFKSIDGKEFFDAKAVGSALNVPSNFVVRWTSNHYLPCDEATTKHHKRLVYTADAVIQAMRDYNPAEWNKPAIADDTPHESISLEKYVQLNKVTIAQLVKLPCIVDSVTKTTNNSKKTWAKPTRFVCPFCGSREMEAYTDGDGVTRWHCDCLNGTKNNDEIIAAHLGFDPKTDRDKIFAYAKQFLPNVGEELESSAPPVDVNVGIFADSTTITTPPPVDEKTQLIIDDLDLYSDGFEQLSETDKRGIRDETARRFKIGVAQNWRHPTMPNSTATPRVIFPLGGAGDVPAYNAIMTNTGRKKFKRQMEAEIKWANKSLTAGTKLIFNPVALTADFCFVTEGEFDAMSILQAAEWKVGACALGGARLHGDLQKRLGRMKNPPMIIVMLDRDAESGTGQKAAPELVEKLTAMHVPAVAKFLDDFLTDDEKKLFVKRDDDGNIVYDDEGKPVIKVDANAILTELGDDKLKEILFKILADAKPELERLAEKFKVDRDNAPPATTDSNTTLPNIPVGSTRKKSSHDKNLSPGIQKVLDAVNNALTADNVGNFLPKAGKRGHICPKCGNGGHSKGTGVDFKTDPPRVVCHCGWSDNALGLFAMKNNLSLERENFFTTLRAAADYFGIPYGAGLFEFKPKQSARKNIYANADTSQLADDATQANETDPKVAEWENVNGKADPALLNQLPQAVRDLEAITPENLTVEIVFSSQTLTAVALCQVYDFRATTAQKFFVTVETAKKNAAAQIKSAADNSGFVAEPADEVKMLAALSIADIKAAVKKLVTDIRKRQKNFTKHWESKQRQEKAQRELEEYKQNLPTTQKVIPTCPVDLILPSKIFIAPDGCGTQYFDGQGIRHELAAITPAVVTKIFRENGTDELEYEVAILSRGQWKRKIVAAATLTTAREVGNLASIGLLAEDTKSLAKYFCRLLKANEETIPEITTYTRPGWHGDKFIYPGTPDADYRVHRAGIDYDSIFRTHGDAQAWKKKFVEVTSSGGQICLKRIAVGACLAAPLLKVIKIPNFHLHIEGTSNYAKTPLPKLGLSVFGNPTEGGLLRGWNSTAKNRLTMAAGFCDLPQGLDELEALSKKDEESLAKNIYEFSLGIVNQANQRNGDARPAEHFRSVRVSTGERGLLKDNDKRGAFKRALTLPIEQPLFSDDEARNLHCFLSENFGHFGRQWVEYIAQHQNEIKADFEGICQYFTKSGFKREMEVVSVDSIDKTNFRDVVACAVAFHHFNFMLEANGEKFDAERAVLDAQEILATLPTVDDLSDIKRSIKLLASWIVENPTRFITPKLQSGNGTSDNDPPPSLDELNDKPADSFAGTVGKKFANGDVGFFQNAFRRIIEKDLELPSYVKFLRDAYTENILDCPSRREKTRKISIDGRKISVYIFKASELFPDEQSVDEENLRYYDL